MKVIKLSDETYDRLKKCVVDPFEDTPEYVINRLIEIADKAKGTYSPWDNQPDAQAADEENQSAEEENDDAETSEGQTDTAEPEAAHAPQSKAPRKKSWEQQADPVL